MLNFNARQAHEVHAIDCPIRGGSTLSRRWLAIIAVVQFLAINTLFAESAPQATVVDQSQDTAFEVIDPHALHLRAGKIDLNPQSSLHHAAAGQLQADGYYVLQLEGPLTSERISTLQQAGIRLGDYLPANSYIIHLSAGYDIVTRLAQVDFVRWVGPFEKTWKLDPEIGQRQVQSPGRMALAAANRLQLVVALFAGEDLAQGVNSILAIPGTVLVDAEQSGEMVLVELTIAKTDYPKLADIPAVQWVEESGEAIKRNNTNRWILQSNVTNSTPVWNHGIHGEGQIGGHIDGAVKTSHCSFSMDAGKVVAFFGSTGSDSHGTHTAGTFLGDELPADGLGFRGMAYKAKLVFTNLDTQITSSNLNTKFQQAHNSGARVHSNSWGDDDTTSYNAWARDIDVFTYANEDDLVCFAVTNLNAAIKNPENAKNCLAVSACTDNPATSHCSGGRAFTNDTRRKPEVMAPGCSTVSCQSSTSCSFTGSGFTGTSMACPAVAGSAILARQYYMDGFYPTGTAVPANSFTPSGALVKATIINSGVDLTGITGFPSDQEGWGRVLLDNALYFSGDASNLIVLADIRNVSGLTTGQNLSYNISVTGNSRPLKVTLVWTEKEGALNATQAFINNLNLEVTSPSSVLYRGNVFTSGQSSSGGTADARNNVEQVLLTTPTVGDYTVTVTAPTVNTATPQGFALVVTGAVTLPVPVTCMKGDVSIDGIVDGNDIDRFVQVYLNGGGTPVEICAGDLEASPDGAIDDNDMTNFVDCLLQGGCP